MNEPNGQSVDQPTLDAAAADLARTEAAVIFAQANYDAARRTLALAELELNKAESLRNTARDFYHALRSPTRQHSAITR